MQLVSTIHKANKAKFLGLTLGVMSALLFFLSTDHHGLFFSNQNSYFPHGLRLAGSEALHNDWYSQTKSAHILFTLLVAGLDRLQALQAGVDIIEGLLIACFLLAAWLLVTVLYRDIFARSELSSETVGKSRETYEASAVLIAILVVATRGLLQLPDVEWFSVTSRRLWDIRGMADQYILGGYLQPSEFGILILLGIVLTRYRRWRLSVVLIAIAAVFQFSYILHALALLTIIVVWLYIHDEKRLALQCVILFGVIAAPMFVYVGVINAGETETAAALDILVNQRFPHHALPQSWWSKTETQRLVVMGLASVILFLRTRGILRWMLSIGTAYVSAGVVVVLLTRSNQLAVLFPWRASVYLYPLSVIVILVTVGGGILWLLARLRYWDALRLVLLLILMIGLIVAIRQQVIAAQSQNVVHNETNEILEFAQAVGTVTTPEDVILVPIQTTFRWSEFRLGAQRPIFVDWKSHPYVASDVLEWSRRVEVARNFYNWPEERRQEICSIHGIQYYIFSEDDGHRTREPFVVSTERYGLVRCGTS